MTSEMDSMWMENLEEFVFEEKKAVTYKWLSRTLNIHVNVAKQMLFAFAEKYKDKVNIVYLVAGKQANNNISVQLIKGDDELKVALNKFTSLTSKHVHTVAAKDDADKLLSAVNLLTIEIATRKEFTPTNAFSGIINKRAVPRASRHVEASDRKPASVVVKAEPKESPKPTIDLKPEKEVDTKSKKASGIQQMFEKSSTATKQTEKAAPAATSSSAKPSKAAGKAGSIAGMFAKQAASSQSTSKSASSARGQSPDSSPGKENRINEEREKKEKEAAASLKKVKESKEQQQQQSKKRGKKSAAGNDSKRRKRIQVASDSESGESEEEHVDEPMVDSPPPPQAMKIESDDEADDFIPATPVLEDKAKRHRVMKKKKKTFEDEDGFIVTKEVMESCSEDSEAEDVIKKNKSPAKSLSMPAKTNSVEKKSSQVKESSLSAPVIGAAKPKQASIMSFFQKK